MGIASSEAGESNQVRLDGAIDISQAAELKAVLLKAFDQGKPVHVSLEQVTGLDVTAFQLLCAAKQQAAQSGLEFSLEGRPAPPACQSLASAGLDGLGIF